MRRLPGRNLHLWLPARGRLPQRSHEPLVRLRRELLLRPGLHLRQELMPNRSRGASRGTSYIGRNKWLNARLTFSGRCNPRRLRL